MWKLLVIKLACQYWQTDRDFLDFVHHVTDVKTQKFYVSESGSAFAFRQEAPTLLDPIDRAILNHWVLTTTTLTSVDKKEIVSVCSTV